MLNEKELKEFCETARKSISKIILRDWFDVKDKVGFSKFINECSDNKTFYISMNLMTLNENEIPQFLNSIYLDYLRKQNKNVHLTSLSENINAIENLVIEEKGNEDPVKQWSELISKGMYGACGYSIVRYILKDPKHAIPKLKALKNQLGAEWIVAKKNIAILRVLAKPIEGTAKISYSLLNKIAQKVESFTGGEPQDAAQMRFDFDKAKRYTPGQVLKKAGRVAAGGLLLAGGITGLVIGLQQLYDKFLSPAAKSCNGQKNFINKKICILKYQINACEQVIDRAKKESLSCEGKDDPSKCKTRVNQEIWQWTRKKQKYSEQLQKLQTGSVKSKLPVFKHLD